MTMNRAFLVLLFVLLVTQPALAQKPTRAPDPNLPASAVAAGGTTKVVPGAEVAEWVFGQGMANQERPDPDLPRLSRSASSPCSSGEPSPRRSAGTLGAKAG
jgi:hypothetical protein